MNENTGSDKHLIPLAIIVAGGLVALAIYFGGSGSGQVANKVEVKPENIEIPLLKETDHIVGSRTAELIVIEYSDTECPFCKTFHNTMKEVVRIYNGKVSWVYRHFPIASLHSKAIKEAEATECAFEQGGNQAFWNYINKVFDTTKSNDSLDPAELPKIAAAVGLDVTAFNTCLSSGRQNKVIQDSIKEAIESGARGTPYSVIITQDGKKVLINGAEPMDMVREKIDALLD